MIKYANISFSKKTRFLKKIVGTIQQNTDTETQNFAKTKKKTKLKTKIVDSSKCA